MARHSATRTAGGAGAARLMLPTLAAAALLLCARPAGAQQEAASVTYTNYTLFRVVPTLDEQVEGLRKLEAKAGVDVWLPPRLNASADFLVAPDAIKSVHARFRSLDLQEVKLLRNLQEHNNQVDIDENMLGGDRSGADASIDNKRYPQYNEIEDFILGLAAHNPTRVKLHDVGLSSEGRRMRVVQVSDCAACKHPAVWLDAGQSGREWMAPAAALHALAQLASNTSAPADMRRRLDWFILAVANPDGYQFTQTKDRLWHKTRSKTSNPGCSGVDLNRNFDFHWNGVGASTDPCSKAYAGKEPFSEMESANMRSFIWNHRRQIKLYISYHAYGNLLLYPWSFQEAKPNNWQTLESVASKANKAMVEAGSEPYTIGSAMPTQGPSAGSSSDWAKGVAGIPLAYTVKLPGFEEGFQPAPRRIDEVARQSFEGLRAFATEVQRLYSEEAQSNFAFPQA